MSAVLELRRVSKHFSASRVVDDVSLDVPAKAFYSLLGPSGCGKTTTLRMIAGFEAASHGEILLDGQSVNHLPPYRRNVSTVFQNYALFPHLTAGENIAFGLERRGAENIPRRVQDALALVRLTGKEKRYPAQLSGGERQRVALARSLVLQPRLLLLDEPLAALDPALRKQMRTELKELQAEVGTTFLFVTHDREEALSLSDRIAVMHAGRVEQIGTPKEIYLRPANRFVAGFLGAVNWIDGVGIRPEALSLSANGLPSGVCSRNAAVVRSTFLGNCLHVEARLQSGEPIVVETPRPFPAVVAGDAVQVWWHPADEMRFP
ncbi:MAG: ABC transporter ATP-binding protein [Bryobacteraceae bacterium]